MFRKMRARFSLCLYLLLIFLWRYSVRRIIFYVSWSIELIIYASAAWNLLIPSFGGFSGTAGCI